MLLYNILLLKSFIVHHALLLRCEQTPEVCLESIRERHGQGQGTIESDVVPAGSVEAWLAGR